MPDNVATERKPSAESTSRIPWNTNNWLQDHKPFITKETSLFITYHHLYQLQLQSMR